MGGENDLPRFITEVPAGEGLWDGRYKIPWDEPEFSRRMLREHLSQEHDLAGRRKDVITAQTAWIDKVICAGGPRRLPDLGCGPGLYISEILDGVLCKCSQCHESVKENCVSIMDEYEYYAS